MECHWNFYVVDVITTWFSLADVIAKMCDVADVIATWQMLLPLGWRFGRCYSQCGRCYSHLGLYYFNLSSGKHPQTLGGLDITPSEKHQGLHRTNQRCQAASR